LTKRRQRVLGQRAAVGVHDEACRLGANGRLKVDEIGLGDPGGHLFDVA